MSCNNLIKPIFLLGFAFRSSCRVVAANYKSRGSFDKFNQPWGHKDYNNNPHFYTDTHQCVLKPSRSMFCRNRDQASINGCKVRSAPLWMLK